MILADTSIWVNHFRKTSGQLTDLLAEDRVLVHPFIIGELAVGGLVNRHEILTLLQALPAAEQVTHPEALAVVRDWTLDGRGVGWVDVHLFASALLASAQLWTTDKRLAAVSSEAGIGFP